MLSSHTILNEYGVVKTMENILAIVYLYLVVCNLIWFVKPLKERDDFLHLETWFEERVDACQKGVVGMILCPWRWKMGGGSRNSSGSSGDGGSNNNPTTLVENGRRVDREQEDVFLSSTRGTVRRKHTGDCTTTTSTSIGGAMMMRMKTTTPPSCQEKND